MYGGGDDDDGDLMAIVRSCSRLIKGKGIAGTPPSASDPLSCLPPPPPPSFPMGMEESLSKKCPDLVTTNQTMLGGFEDIYSSFVLPLQPPQPHPQPPQPYPQTQPQQQTGLFQTLLVAAGAEGPTTTMVSKPLGQQSSLKQMGKPLTMAMKRKCESKKVEKKRVVRLSMNIRVPNDNWAWRKYGEKPIKGSSYPRSYYRCSTCKSCPARKMVDKSQWDPKMFAITYIGEHNHPLSTHCNCTADITCRKYSTSSSGDKKVDNGEGTPSELSPITLLATPPSMEMEDGEEAMLDTEDMEVIGDDKVTFLGDAQLNTPVAAGSSLLFSEAKDLFLSQLWDNDNVFFDNNDGGVAAGEGQGGAN